MKNRIPQLPRWCLTGTRPAFYDTESSTAIEQTAKIYGAMQDLINDYNNFADELNTTINTFVNDSNADQEEFENHINKIVHDYIIMLDEKLKLQDKEIEENIVYIKENLSASVEQIITEMRENGELDEVIEEVFEELSTKVDSLETTVDEMNPKVIKLETSVNGILTDLPQVKEDISNIEDRLDVLYFDSIEDLKASEILKAGDIVKTLGYYEQNDGGSARYVIRQRTESDVEDYGSIHFIGDLLIAELVIENRTINIKQFGVKTDGTKDQHIVFQNAVEKLTSIGGGTIYIPDGTYIMGYNMYNTSDGSEYGIVGIQLHSNISLIGQSKNAILKLTTSTFGSGAFYRLIGSDMGNDCVENVTIKNLTIDGSYENQLNGNTNVNNILINAKRNILIENVNSLNCRGNGILVTGRISDVAENITIKNCYVDTVDMIGIQCSQFNGCHIVDNKVFNCKNNGIDIYGDDGVNSITTYNFNISNNIIDGALCGIFPETVKEGIVVDNNIKNCTDGVHINSINAQSTDIVIQSNHIRDCQNGICHTGPQMMIFDRENTIENYSVSGISLQNTSNIEILNNIFKPHMNVPAFKTVGNSCTFIRTRHNYITFYQLPSTTNIYLEKGATSHTACKWDINTLAHGMFSQASKAGTNYVEISIPKFPSSYTGKLTIIIDTGNVKQITEYSVAMYNGEYSMSEKVNVKLSGNDDITSTMNYLNDKLLVYTSTASSLKYKFEVEEIASW